MKPANLSMVSISPVSIGLTVITKFEIDMIHINHGIDKGTKNYKLKARSNFSELEVANIFSLLDGYFLTPSGKQDNYLYFAHQISYIKRNYILAFCIDKNAIQTAGIITLYKIKNQNKS